MYTFYLPNYRPNHLKTLKKCFSKSIVFLMLIFHRFGMNLGPQNHPKNEVLDTPNSPQDTPGAPPGRASSQKGFPNSMFDGLRTIWSGFWKDLGTNMDRKVVPKHAKSAP